MKVGAVLETCLYAENLDAAERFYAGVLGLVPFARMPGRHVFFRCGEAVFLVFDPRQTAGAGSMVPAHGAHGPGHVAFAVADQQLDRWRSHLQERGVAIEAEVEWPNGGTSLYLRDPAGNSVELAPARIWGFQPPAPAS
jgi:catechol 2,3-dioxygenase-like lactoylglutathione lyase family enzyme